MGEFFNSHRIYQHLPGSGDPALQSQVLFLVYARNNEYGDTRNQQQGSIFSESLFRFRETVRYGVVDDGLHLARGLF